MSYHGDLTLGDTLDLHFTTTDANGVPATLGGTPAVAAYPDNGTAEITAGITLTVDFDARTGLHHVRVEATAGNGFTAGTNYTLVLTAGTVDTNSVEGYVIGSFSVEARLTAVEVRDEILSDSTPFAGGNVDAAISSRSSHAAADVVTVSLSELSQGAPPASPTLEQALMLLYMALRNQEEQTASEYRITADDGTVIAKASLSDDGTTVTKAELVSGP